MCVLIFSTAFSETYLVLRRNERDRYKMCIGTPYSFKILTTLEFSQQIFEKYTNTKFIENPSSGNRVVPCGTDRQTDLTQLIVAVRNSAHAPQHTHDFI